MHKFRFGSDIQLLRRLALTFAITYLIIARRARVCIPDSDCTICRYLANLLLLLGKKNNLMLVPDGFITSKPLSLRRYKSCVKRPISREAVLASSQAWSSSTQVDTEEIKLSVVVALKCPQGMNEADALSLARMMLSLASYTSKSMAIGVSCHRTMRRSSIERLIDELRQSQLDNNIHAIRYQLAEFHSLHLESITTLHSLPSTVIWQVWQANSRAQLHLYDPTKQQTLTAGRWKKELETSIKKTREVAEMENHQRLGETTESDGLRIEVWQ